MTDPIANILIVDDRPDKLLALEAVLEDLGQTIVTATSGRDGLRHVLQTDFAVILLDVNMPGMDGFETAGLIRQRRRSEHTPIIFITAFGDEMHAARGYGLGAVDYILAPVMPDVLRTKVAVFVDLFRKSEQVRTQADALRRRAGQLQKLAAASLSINAAASIHGTLQSVTDAARDVVGTHQAITLYGVEDAPAVRVPGGPASHVLVSFSDKFADWADRPLDLDRCAQTTIGLSPVPVRLTQQQLQLHADWPVVRKLRLPPIRGVLAAPVLGRDGRRVGLVYLTDKLDGTDFTPDDEAVVVQLTQMASVAIENIIFSKEREANRIKDEFLATLSHELRTPLNAIVGWTQLLQMEDLSEDVARGLEVIDRNAKSQTKLIEDLLDVSRITTGKLRLSLRPAGLGAIVRGVVDAVRPQSDAKRVALDLPDDGLDAPALTIDGDPDRLQQVVWNLLTNAVKFTPPEGRISVRLHADGPTARLTVADTGAGIAPEFLPFVFDRFRQADSTSTRAFGGLGIGLTIVRHIVELHGGAVEAHSDGPGCGSTFTVCLPATAGSNGQAADAPSAEPATATPTTPAQAHGPRKAELAGVTVLAVDDEADARDVVAEILRRAGAAVTLAPGTAEALDLFPAVRPDVLVSDIAMPGDDGFALIAQVRGRRPDAGGHVPAVALTAYARVEDQVRTRAAGFDAHLAKPVSPADLVATVARLARAASTTATTAGGGHARQPLNRNGQALNGHPADPDHDAPPRPTLTLAD